MTLHFDCSELGLAPPVLVDSAVCAFGASVERSALLSLGISLSASADAPGPKPSDGVPSSPSDADGGAKANSSFGGGGREEMLASRQHMIEEVALVSFDCKLFLFVCHCSL